MTTTHPSLHDDLELAALLAYQTSLHEARVQRLGAVRAAIVERLDEIERKMTPYTVRIEGVDFVDDRPAALLSVGGLLVGFDVERGLLAFVDQCAENEGRVRCDRMTTTSPWERWTVLALDGPEERLARLGKMLSQRATGVRCVEHGPF